MKLNDKQFIYIYEHLINIPLYNREHIEELVDTVLSAINGEMGKNGWELFDYRVDNNWENCRGNWEIQQRVIEEIFGIEKYNWKKVWNKFDKDLNKQDCDYWSGQLEIIKNAMEKYKL